MAEYDRDPVLVTGCSTGIGRAAGAGPARPGTHRVGHRAAPRDAGRPRRRGRPRDGPRRHRRGLDGGSRCARSRRRTARSARSSTTPATASTARSRRWRWTRCGPCSRPTSSGWPGCASSCCPACGAAGRGRIVNLSSMGGRMTFPLGGYYHATKYAVEALSDALRVEVRPFGIQVVVVEPGVTRSGFEETISASGCARLARRLPLRRDARVGGRGQQRGLRQPAAVGLVRERRAGPRQGDRGRPSPHPLPAHPGRQGHGDRQGRRRRPRLGRHRDAASSGSDGRAARAARGAGPPDRGAAPGRVPARAHPRRHLPGRGLPQRGQDAQAGRRERAARARRGRHPAGDPRHREVDERRHHRGARR